MREDGLYWDEERQEEWSDFTGFAFLGENGGYFAVRLRRRVPLDLREPLPPLRAALRNGTNTFRAWLQITPYKLLTALFFLTPPLLCAVATLAAWQQVSWRVDVQAAVLIVAAYALALLLPVKLGFHLLTLAVVGKVHPLMRNKRSDAEDGTDTELKWHTYLIFDSREVTAQHRLTCYLVSGEGTPV